MLQNHSLIPFFSFLFTLKELCWYFAFPTTHGLIAVWHVLVSFCSYLLYHYQLLSLRPFIFQLNHIFRPGALNSCCIDIFIYQKLLLRMSLQQLVQPRSSGNAFSRRRADREMGGRQDNKVHSGKSPSNLNNTGGDYLADLFLISNYLSELLLSWLSPSNSFLFGRSEWQQSRRVWWSFTGSASIFYNISLRTSCGSPGERWVYVLRNISCGQHWKRYG